MQLQTYEQEIPQHLLPLIAKQDPSLYTPIDQASWRFILKISQSFFSRHAHQKYLDGLVETGISIERIPLIQDIDDCLRKFHWRAVPVAGFIPPGAFMEFLSLGILPIACAVRTLEHLGYTPAPDIIHEAAGHAPILSDPEYATYLRSYGEISRKAIFSSQDTVVYQSIRRLSDVKEDPHSTEAEIQAAQVQLDEAIRGITYVSEASLLSRMAWWTFEYGLIGSLEDPKIYGAGLLSSISESYHCLSPKVQKLPFSIDCIQTGYDITQPQPQLYVTPDFQTLKNALNELANQMAFRQGGVSGLEKAKQAETVTTVVLDSGVQITGIVSHFDLSPEGRPEFIRWRGPCQLAYDDLELAGQGVSTHSEGFSTPVEDMSAQLLKEGRIVLHQKNKIRLQSGILVEGILKAHQEKKGRIILLTFEECTVTRGAEILFKPEWGQFDMVCGYQIISVFGGAADRNTYPTRVEERLNTPFSIHKSNLTSANEKLNQLYSRVRDLRESIPLGTHSPQVKSEVVSTLSTLYQELKKSDSSDWLLRYEILEILANQNREAPWKQELLKELETISQQSGELAELIRRGMELITNAR